MIARPPLHGHPELLPAALPWSFVGAADRRPARPHASASRRVIVADVRPPTSLGLPSLAPLVPAFDDGVVVISGASATRPASAPSSPTPATSRSTLTASPPHGTLRFSRSAPTSTAGSRSPPPTSPRAGSTARRSWFSAHAGAPRPHATQCAGACPTHSSPPVRAVVASATAIPDDQGAALFAVLRARIARGEPVATAVAALRADRLAAGQPWAAGLMVFE